MAPNTFGRAITIFFRTPSSPDEENSVLVSSASDGPSLKLGFDIEKNLSGASANSGTFVLVNLSQTTRQKLNTQKNRRFYVTAGYVGKEQIMFQGDITKIEHQRRGTEWITTISAGDGVNAISGPPESFSLKPGSTPDQVAQQALNYLSGKYSIAPGNTLTGVTSPNSVQVYEKGFCDSANATQLLQMLAKSTGRNFSIQNCTGQINGSVDTNPVEEPVVLTAKTGLIEATDTGDDGFISITCLLQPKLIPGDPVEIESKFIAGGAYRIEVIKHRGDTHEKEWYSEMELKPTAGFVNIKPRPATTEALV